MVNQRSLLFLLSVFIILSGCSSSSDEPQIEETILTVSDFNKTIDENPDNDDSLGKIQITSNKDNIRFSIDSQTIQSSIRVDTKTGELFVNDKSKFNFEINESLEGIVKISSNNVSKTANFTITISDIIEPNEYTFVNSSNPLFTERNAHKSVVFKDKIWIIGGINQTGGLNDIWTSENGTEWEKEVISGDLFSPRFNHEVVVFNNKIWVIGGRYHGEIYLNDIWSSDDGLNWVEEVSSDLSVKVWSHNIVVFQNKMWLSGGHIKTQMSNRLLYSENGINWIEVNNQTSNFPRISYHEVVNFNNKLWLIGGYNGSNSNEIWSSENGVDWNKQNINGDIFSPRSSHQVVIFQNRIWITGGFNQNEKALNDIWSSENGVGWKKEKISITTTNNVFNSIYNHQSVVFKGKIWLLGGQTSNSGNGKNYIWHSN